MTRPSLIMLSVVLWSGAAARAAAPGPTGGDPPLRAPGDLHCAAPLAAAAAILDQTPAAILAIGAFPGTAEPLRFVGELVCHAAEHRAVVLGLEMEQGEQPALDTYLSSLGGHADQAELLRGSFWTSPLPNGYQSAAAAALLDYIRSLRQQGALIRVVALKGGQPGEDLDERLALAVAQARSDAPRSTLLTLTNPLRARVDVPTSMAGILRAQNFELVALNTAFRGGTTWACSSGATDAVVCRVLYLVGSDRGADRFFRRLDGPARMYDGLIYLGLATASPPAISGHTDAGPPLLDCLNSVAHGAAHPHLDEVTHVGHVQPQ